MCGAAFGLTSGPAGVGIYSCILYDLLTKKIDYKLMKQQGKKVFKIYSIRLFLN